MHDTGSDRAPSPRLRSVARLWHLWRRQWTNPLSLILVIGAALALLTGNRGDAAAVLLILLATATRPCSVSSCSEASSARSSTTVLATESASPNTTAAPCGQAQEQRQTEGHGQGGDQGQ